jgi:uncharacterized Ntn-hydrolase superfamily protein
MTLKEYTKLQEIENNNQIAVDFDGVIHKNSKGFFDGTVYDNPIEGSLDAIKEISKRFDIIIFTAKASKDRPLINGKTGKEHVVDWLKENGFYKYIKDVVVEKPRAVLYIDDKAFRFENWVKTTDFVSSINT